MRSLDGARYFLISESSLKVAGGPDVDIRESGSHEKPSVETSFDLCGRDFLVDRMGDPGQLWA
jgi:hypothetical protein